MTGFDLRHDAFEHRGGGDKAHFRNRWGSNRLFPPARLAPALRSWPALSLPRIASALFRPWRSRSAFAPVASRSIAVPAVVRPGRSVFFAGKIGVGIFVRRFLHPGGQELQIKKIRRGFLLGHESLYAMAEGCKIGGAIWCRLDCSKKQNILTTNPIKLVANVSRRR